jgi:hypothetical protein
MSWMFAQPTARRSAAHGGIGNINGAVAIDGIGIGGRIE